MGFSGVMERIYSLEVRLLSPEQKKKRFMQHLQPNTTLQGGKYRIERVLGQGGFGNTYIATNTVFDDHVAIKEFFMQGVNDRDENSGTVTIGVESNTQQFDEQKEKFKKEARRLWKLKNEHIVKVHDLFEENGTAYYVMDYIDGESLAEKLKRTGKPMSEQDIKKLLPQILDALKEVHQNEIWHLDLKPGNIMLDKQGNIYLIDFGASKQIRANGSMTTSTALCYTPGYAPNEQIGQMYDRFGPWTDIYALGATIYNLLTNKKPPMVIDIEEDGENAFEFPSNVSENLRKLVVWMMQPKRKARPQGVEEIFLKLSAAEIKKEKPQIERDTEETIIAGPVQADDEETFLSSKCTAKDANMQNIEKLTLAETDETENEYYGIDDNNEDELWTISFIKRKWKFLLAGLLIAFFQYYFICGNPDNFIGGDREGHPYNNEGELYKLGIIGFILIYIIVSVLILLLKKLNKYMPWSSEEEY